MSAQISTHTLSEVRDILRILWSDPALPAALIIGPPGCGKSTMVADLAAEMGLGCETMMANIREPSDFAGLPVVRENEVQMLPLEWAARIADKPYVLFLDEINTARPATIAALLRVVLDRVVGNVKLGPNVRIVAAMNPTEESAHGWELPPALANRFYHFSVSPTPTAQWREWVLANTDSPEIITALDQIKADSLHDPATSGPFGSPRSWYAGIRGAAAMRKAGRPDLAAALVAASVGVGNAITWNTNFNTGDIDWNIPQPAHIIRRAITEAAHKIGLATDQDRQDQLWSVLELATANNVAATFAVVGQLKNIIHPISTNPRSQAILRKLSDAAKSIT